MTVFEAGSSGPRSDESLRDGEFLERALPMVQARQPADSARNVQIPLASQANPTTSNTCMPVDPPYNPLDDSPYGVRLVPFSPPTRRRSANREGHPATPPGQQRRQQSGGQDRTLRRRRFLTWNLGGMQMDRLPDILATLGIMGIGDVAIVAFQEVNMQEGIHYLKAGPTTDEWLIVAGKQQGEWRGRATAVRRSLG